MGPRLRGDDVFALVDVFAFVEKFEPSSRRKRRAVIPAHAGIHAERAFLATRQHGSDYLSMGPGVRRDDGLRG
jgi:hypothetical protein